MSFSQVTGNITTEVSSDNNEENTDVRTSSTASSSSGATAGVVVNHGIFIYKLPVDYFDLKTGLVPKEPEHLKLRWPLRKKRQVAVGPLIDEESFDAEALKHEMESLRESLRDFTHHEYMEHVKKLLSENDFLRPDDQQRCSSLVDVCKMIANMPNLNLGKADILFEIFHYKHAAWTCNTVDGWAEKNKINIVLQKTETTKKRQPNKQYYRGAFNLIVNERRMQDVKRIMGNMWRGQSWKIAVAICNNNAPGVLYTNKTWEKDKTINYYIVEKEDPGSPEPEDQSLVIEVCYCVALSMFVHTF
jgi:hypothetical protein